MNESNPDIAIAHKDYAVAGGGEVLAERLGVAFDAPVYTGYVVDQNRCDVGADVRGLWNDGFVNTILQRRGIGRALLYQHLWEYVPELHSYDVVIQSGNEPLWYVPPDTQTTIAYTHSTPRLMYDMYPRLSKSPDSKLGIIGEAINRFMVKKQREKYLHVTKYPDLWVANSDLVARRLQRYFDIDREKIDVVYPPTPVDEYGPRHADGYENDFYLSVNRLDDWKRIDEVVDAFKYLDERLVIAGKGPAKPDLEERASGHDNIEFLGYVTETEKKQLMAAANAVVYNPLNEDFGMVPIEALASGTPVISVDDGFQQWQLTDGEVAVKYERSTKNRDVTVRNLRAAVQRFEHEAVTEGPDGLQQAALPYRIERFEREMEAAVEKARSMSAIQPHDVDLDIDLEGGRDEEPEAVVADGGSDE